MVMRAPPPLPSPILTRQIPIAANATAGPSRSTLRPQLSDANFGGERSTPQRPRWWLSTLTR